METSIFRQAPSRRSPWNLAGAYTLALLSSVLAAGATLLLRSYLNFSPLVLLYFAVFVSGRLGGVGPGLLAMALTAGFAEQYVLPAPWDFKSGWRDVLPLGVYALVSMATLAVVCKLRARTAVLREKEEQLTDFMEHATIGLHWLAEDGTIIWANKAACELLGYPRSAYVGRNARDFHWEAQESAEILRRLGRKEWLKNYPARLRTRDGSSRDVLLDANVLWQSGKFVHARCFLRDVTSCKAAEQALGNERNLLRTLIDALPDCVYTKDREGRFVVANQASMRLLGVGHEEEIRGKMPTDLGSGEMAGRYMENDQQVLNSGAPLLDHEEVFVMPNGEARTFFTAKVPLRDPSGEVIGLVGISRDITDQKRAEQALRKSEAGLRLAQRIGRIGSWEVDLRKSTTEWSEETYRIFGCRPGLFHPTTEGFFALVHPEDRELVRRARLEGLEHHKQFSVDYRIVGDDGSERFVAQQARIIRDETGAPIQLIGTVQEITERKLAEAALRESEERFRILFEHSPEAIFILDPQGGDGKLPIVDCNEVACRRHGYTRKELIGQSFSLLDEALEDPEKIEQFVRRVRQSRVIQAETSRRRKDGSRFYFESWTSLITTRNRDLMLDMGRDISERKKAEAAVHRVNEELEARVLERTRQLEQANRELEAFSYSISHDLRAPVRAITGFSQIIAAEYGHQFEGELARLFNLISKSGQRMGELIDDLLSFSRLNALELRRAPVNMTALVRSVAAELRSHQTNGHARVQVADLPPASGDESMLRQVITNLLANALKFSRNAAEPTVAVDARHHQNRIVYIVRDNGVGFDMKYASKLFKVFQRLHKPEQFEGTGVGLAIVQRVVHRHGGQVWAESKPGEGATFCFSLPMDDERNGHQELGSSLELAGWRPETPPVGSGPGVAEKPVDP
jgi:PAS domain S-box-containing protein